MEASLRTVFFAVCCDLHFHCYAPKNMPLQLKCNSPAYRQAGLQTLAKKYMIVRLKDLPLLLHLSINLLNPTLRPLKD